MSRHNDPWTPVNQADSATINGPSGDPPQVVRLPGAVPQDPRLVMASSEDYIASLEAKLKRLKGRRKEGVSSRDIVDSLCRVREDHMRNYIASTGDPFSSSFSQADDETIETSALQRRLHPERQALNAEELQALVEKDELQKVREAEEDGKDNTNHPRIPSQMQPSSAEVPCIPSQMQPSSAEVPCIPSQTQPSKAEGAEASSDPSELSDDSVTQATAAVAMETDVMTDSQLPNS